METQRDVHRAYCLTRYGHQNLRCLTKEDRKLLEITVKINTGSTIFSSELDSIFNLLASTRIENMTPEQLLIIGSFLTGAWAFKYYMNERSQKQQHEFEIRKLEKEHQFRIDMSDKDNEKIEVISKAINQSPQMKEMSECMNQTRNLLLSNLDEKDEMFMNEEKLISGAEASRLIYEPRQKAVEQRLDGLYSILSVKSGHISGYRLDVRDVNSGEYLTVGIVAGQLTTKQENALKTGEWEKRPVHMEINAKRLRGYITKAALVSVDLPEETE